VVSQRDWSLLGVETAQKSRRISATRGHLSRVVLATWTTPQTNTGNTNLEKGSRVPPLPYSTGDDVTVTSLFHRRRSSSVASLEMKRLPSIEDRRRIDAALPRPLALDLTMTMTMRILMTCGQYGQIDSLIGLNTDIHKRETQGYSLAYMEYMHIHDQNKENDLNVQQ